MLKHGIPSLLEPLKYLFNFIFNKGQTPKTWNASYIVPIYKKGSKLDPAYYRGISLT